MNVYVEYVIIDNMFFDSVILFGASALLHLHTPWWRVMLGAVVGTACAFASCIVGGVLAYVVKLVCLVAMCCVTVGWGATLVKHVVATLVLTFVMGGACIALISACGVQFTTANGFCYSCPVPLGLYGVAVALFVALCRCIVAYVTNARAVSGKCVSAVLQLSSPVRVTAFCDTGNTLQHNGVPVCFVMRNVSGVKTYFATNVLQGNKVDVSVATVTGVRNVTAVPCVLQLCNATHNVLLALPLTKNNVIYDVLLNSSLGVCNEID